MDCLESIEKFNKHRPCKQLPVSIEAFNILIFDSFNSKKYVILTLQDGTILVTFKN